MPRNVKAGAGSPARARLAADKRSGLKQTQLRRRVRCRREAREPRTEDDVLRHDLSLTRRRRTNAAKRSHSSPTPDAEPQAQPSPVC